jgi:hypothetical protein
MLVSFLTRHPSSSVPNFQSPCMRRRRCEVANHAIRRCRVTGTCLAASVRLRALTQNRDAVHDAHACAHGRDPAFSSRGDERGSVRVQVSSRAGNAAVIWDLRRNTLGLAIKRHTCRVPTLGIPVNGHHVPGSSHAGYHRGVLRGGDHHIHASGPSPSSPRTRGKTRHTVAFVTTSTPSVASVAFGTKKKLKR